MCSTILTDFEHRWPCLPRFEVLLTTTSNSVFGRVVSETKPSTHSFLRWTSYAMAYGKAQTPLSSMWNTSRLLALLCCPSRHIRLQHQASIPHSLFQQAILVFFYTGIKSLPSIVILGEQISMRLSDGNDSDTVLVAHTVRGE